MESLLLRYLFINYFEKSKINTNLVTGVMTCVNDISIKKRRYRAI